jgi:hypothetical protein
MSTTLTHPGLLALRRALAGEPVDASVKEHLEHCAQCRARAEELGAEQRRFEASVPFERFEQGVELARRRPQWPWARRPSAMLRPATGWVVALAATIVAVFASHGLFGESPTVGSRSKGGESHGALQMIVASQESSARRVTSDDPKVPEALTRGDRVRIGVTPGPWHFVLVMSIDALGTVSPVYAAENRSRSLSGASPEFLPDAVEFTGVGLERIVVLLTDQPLDVDVVGAQLRRRFSEARGDLTKLGDIESPGEQFHRTVLKP